MGAYAANLSISPFFQCQGYPRIGNGFANPYGVPSQILSGPIPICHLAGRVMPSFSAKPSLMEQVRFRGRALDLNPVGFAHFVVRMRNLVRTAPSLSTIKPSLSRSRRPAG